MFLHFYEVAQIAAQMHTWVDSQWSADVRITVKNNGFTVFIIMKNHDRAWPGWWPYSHGKFWHTSDTTLKIVTNCDKNCHKHNKKLKISPNHRFINKTSTARRKSTMPMDRLELGGRLQAMRTAIFEEPAQPNAIMCGHLWDTFNFSHNHWGHSHFGGQGGSGAEI